MSRVIIYILPLFFAVACTIGLDKKKTITVSNVYAKCFAVKEFDDFKVIEVVNPWDSATLLQRYILVPKENDIPANIPSGTIVRTPISRAAVYASLHCGMMREIGVDSTIVGVCDVHFIADKSLKERIKNGEIADMGSSFLPDVEKIISLSPEVIIVSPYQDGSYGKVEQLGIPIIEMADYMEDTPLARTEWLKFIAMLFECEDVADSIFSATETEYLRLSEIGRNVKNKPSLFCELKTGGVWYQPGGASYMAQLYRDAGINYLWSDNAEKGSISLSFEEVLMRGANADLWFIKYADEKDKTISSLLQEYAPYSNFKSCNGGNVWGVNGLKVSFYEDMPIYPHLVLRDFMIIAHPEIFSLTDTTKYYKRLKNE